MTGRVDVERALDAFLAPEADRLPDRVVDAALDEIARTRQMRTLRLLWRFPNVPNLSASARPMMVGALLLFTIAGGALLLGAAGRARPFPSPEASPASSGVTAWTMYTSSVYEGLTFGYPADWSVRAPATRKWQTGDDFPADALPYADTFVSPGDGNVQIGLIIWRTPVTKGTDIESVEGLKSWAQQFCSDNGTSRCGGFTEQAVPMLRTIGSQYASAILVPTATQQFAFIADCNSCLLSGATDTVTVVVIAREDDFAPAARYGGSVGLLKAVLATMHVFPRGTS